MLISPLDAEAARIEAELAGSFTPILATAPAIANRVGGRIQQWADSTRCVLSSEFPLRPCAAQLSAWQVRLQAANTPADVLNAAVDDYIAFCKAAGVPDNEAFWRSRLRFGLEQPAARRQTSDQIAISTRLLMQTWQKQLDQARSRWELELISDRRRALMEELEILLRLLQDLQKRLQALGLDTGLLVDLASGSMAAQDIDQLERWARYLAEDEGIRQICDLLGKMRQIDLSERIERVKSFRPAKNDLPDINSREEIVGLRLGRDLAHVLPAELSLLADPDTELLFDLKYVESRLMCFDMQGIQDVHRHVETEEERSVRDGQKRGPMVICIDTSGSMNGAPETIAKAIALFLAAKAREEKRACYLINFSTGIDTLDLGGDAAMSALMEFLQRSFHGGTDAAPALDHALETMGQDDYRNADLLIVSDFIMATLPEEMLSRIEGQRANGNRFHSLVIGDCYLYSNLATLFDLEWVYDPRHGRIHELTGFHRALTEGALMGT